jgi:tetratricopeptide (TPR) repeat protein
MSKEYPWRLDRQRPTEPKEFLAMLLPHFHQLFVLLALALLVAPARAQDSKPTSQPTGAAHKKGAKTATPLEKLMAAKAAERPHALMRFIEDQIATNAIYAGQYSALRKLDWDVQKLLQKWVSETPKGAVDGSALRNASINALRDLVDGKASDDLRDVLKQVANDWFESTRIKNSAAFALAQFGDRSLVDGAIKKATDQTKAEDVRDQITGWLSLANIYYNLRQYDDAVNAYQQVIKLAAGGGVGLTPTVFYNCGCSLALAGKTDAAFVHVEKALVAGKQRGNQLNKRLLETDMDIKSLRKDPRFAALMAKFFGSKKGKDTPDSRPTSRPDKNR